MKILYYKLSILLFVLSFSFISDAQEVIASAGENSSNSKAQLSWTLGECFTKSYENPMIIINQGVNQNSLVYRPFSNSKLVYNIEVFPNPVQDYLNLLIDKSETSELSYALYDITGHKVLQKKAIQPQERIYTENLPPAVYILQILDSHREVITLKIVKTNP